MLDLTEEFTMNSRVRNRLIGISAVLVIVAIAGVAFMFFNGTSLSLSVERLYNSPQYIGETVQLSGTVVAGSWDRQSNPMTFRVFNEDSDSDAEITAVFNGVPPANFGDGTGVIITGDITEENKIVSSQMVTVCPSRYETSDNAIPVADLFNSEMNMTGIPVRVSARVVDGSIAEPGADIRLVVHDIENTGIELPVAFSGGLADSVMDGVPVVLTGTMNEDGVFEASVVANIADS